MKCFLENILEGFLNIHKSNLNDRLMTAFVQLVNNKILRIMTLARPSLMSLMRL